MRRRIAPRVRRIVAPRQPLRISNICIVVIPRERSDCGNLIPRQHTRLPRLVPSLAMTRV